MAKIFGNTTATTLMVDQTYNSASNKPQSGKAVAEAIAKLLGSAPANLDTLEELAKALNEDENFSASVLAEIAKKADANYVDELAVAIEDTYRLAEKKVDKEKNKTLLEYVPIKDDYYVRWERLNDDIRAPIGVSVAFASSQSNGILEELSDVALVLSSYTDDEIITVITSDGEIYRTKYVVDYEDYEKTGWTEWQKISVSQTDLDTAIGDIETSLENIIKKYGLGGDSV